MDLSAPLAKRDKRDFLRGIAEAVLHLIMGADVEGLIGAARHERSGERTTWRNGYRERALDTRLGTLNLRVPKLRQGRYFPSPPRGPQDLGAGAGGRYPGGVDQRRLDPSSGRTGAGDGPERNLERAGEFLNRPRTGDWPYIWLGATYLKVRQGGRIVPVAAIIAVAANTEGRSEINGLGIGPSEAGMFWTEFLRARGFGGVGLVISGAHAGLKAAIARVFEATWQRCRVHWIRDALAHVSRGQHSVVAAAIRRAFEQPDRAHACETWRKVAEQLRPRWPKLADMSFWCQHRITLHSTNPVERLNKEVSRPADVVGIFPNEGSIMRLLGAVLFEQNGEWQTSSRYLMVEAFAETDRKEIDPILGITTKAA